MSLEQVGHYRIVRPIGAGGMGEVYLAEDTRLHRQVAVKLTPEAAARDPELRDRFVLEARAASALAHPNICVVLDVGEAPDGRLFTAMEYIDGQTLALKINGEPLSVREIIALGIQIADALDEAHAKGITHRDIKPSNIMVTPRGQAKILDFGLVKITRESAGLSTTFAPTRVGAVVGTVAYMSPEQALGRPIDHRTDVFSLGTLLYEMTTGRPPFKGVSTTETIDQIVHAQPPALTRFNYDVPYELERIILKCLAKDADSRYQSTRELVVDLKNLSRELTVAAAHPPAAKTSASNAGRRSEPLWKTGAWALAIGAAVLTVSVGYLATNTGWTSSPQSTQLESRSAIDVKFAATPLVVEAGQPVTLTWDVTGASSVNIDPFGAVTDAGTRIVVPVGTSMYRLTATRGDTQKSASVEVVVKQPAAPARITAPARASVDDARMTRPPEGAAQMTAAPPAEPVEGRVVWTGRLPPGEKLTITRNGASTGEVSAKLPDSAVALQISPTTVQMTSSAPGEAVLQNTGGNTETTVILRWTLQRR